MEEKSKIGKWLGGRCKIERLSLRQAAAKTGLSHATIFAIVRGNRPLPETIRKLARGFGGDGTMALEDHLLQLAGYRAQRGDGDDLTESMARLIDKSKELSESQLKIMINFADYLVEVEEKD